MDVSQTIFKFLSAAHLERIWHIEAAPDGSALYAGVAPAALYRSDDAGETWQEITTGLPSDFGFPLALHPRDPATLYVIPLKGAEFRCPPEGKLRVFRSRNAGETWEALSAGLPQSVAYCGIYREGMTSDQLDPAGIYFGTNTGKIFASRDEGESWSMIADNLPPIYSVEVSALA